MKEKHAFHNVHKEYITNLTAYIGCVCHICKIFGATDTELLATDVIMGSTNGTFSSVSYQSSHYSDPCKAEFPILSADGELPITGHCTDPLSNDLAVTLKNTKLWPRKKIYMFAY